MAMAEFDEIWLFIEQKLKTQVPTYFKNILKVCGYNNGISIASIDASDIKYLEEEVRNGNVSKYFEGKDVEEILEGSTKSIENFVFTRGHQKFLLSIVDFLKTHLEENGPNQFVLELAKPVKTKKSSKKIVFTQKKKFFPLGSVFGSTIQSNLTSNEPSDAALSSDATLSSEVMKEHKQILVTKILSSLRSVTAEMYAKNIEMIKEKISSHLVKVEMILETEDKTNETQKQTLEDESNKAPLYIAEVSCPFCTKTIRVFHVQSGTNGGLRWNTSNFDRHLKKVHINKTDEINTEKDLVQETEKSACENRGEKIPGVSVQKPNSRLDRASNCTITSNEIVSPDEIYETTVVLPDEIPETIVVIPNKSTSSHIGEMVSAESDMNLEENREIITPNNCTSSSEPSKSQSIVKSIVRYSDFNSNAEALEDVKLQRPKSKIPFGEKCDQLKLNRNKTISTSAGAFQTMSISKVKRSTEVLNDMDQWSYAKNTKKRKSMGKQQLEKKWKKY